MKPHLALGLAGEQLAASWLQQKGYSIIERNFRWGKTEIDIVATKGDYLHLIEVKTRSSDRWGMPEQQVSVKKINVMRRVASLLLERSQRKWIQYDAVAITWKKGEPPLLELIEDISS
ncbi:MAG: YraN family protein [Sphingomonadales bacterium]